MSQTPSTKEITFWQLFAYALPALPLAALQLPLFITVPAYYAQSLGLSLGAVGAALMLGRVVDAVLDPVIGYYSDHMRPKVGRRRGWFIISAPLTAVAAYMVFSPPPGASVYYLFFWNLLVSVGYTATFLSYTAWAGELSTTYHGRNRIFAAREVTVILGTLLATGLLAGGSLEVVHNFFAEINMPIKGDGDILNTLGLIILILLPVFAIVTFRSVPEPQDFSEQPHKIVESFQLLFKNKPFLRLVIAFIINASANGLAATLFPFYVTAILKAEPLRWTLLFFYFLCGVLSVPLWIFISKRVSKHRAWCSAMVLAILAFLWVPLIGAGDVWHFKIILVFTGIALAADLLLPISIQADVIDYDTAKTGEQRTGFYFAVWALTNKIALASAIGISFPLLQFMGFDKDGQNHTSAGLTTLVVFYAIVPIILKAIAIFMMWNFPIGAREQAKLRQEIAQHHQH